MSDENEVIDYRLVCRTCLASDAVFYKLEAPIISENEEEKQTTYMECLRYCTHLEEKPELPIYICTECSAALLVAYNFLRNAMEAHEILCRKLCPPLQRNNGKLLDSIVAEKTPMRYRCKICSEKVETKKKLKEHLKLHLDVITYSCRMCSYEAKKRSQLGEHYFVNHGLEPSRELLKAKTLSQSSPINQENWNQDNSADTRDNSNIMQLELIHNGDQTDVSKSLYDQQIVEQQSTTQPAVQKYATNTVENQIVFIGDGLQDRTQPPHALQLNNFKLDELGMNTQIEQQQQQVALEFSQTNSQQIVLDQHAGALIQPNVSIATVLSSNVNGFNTSISTVANTTELGDFNGEFNMSDMSIGNEFVVMEDGTVKEVMGNDVVIEYINAVNGNHSLQNGLVFNDVLQMDTNNSTDVNAMVGINLDDIIIDETASTSVVEEQIRQMSSIEDEIPSTVIQGHVEAKKIKCKICCNHFVTQDKLKNHMLTHDEIPHFFCDHCEFYTFFKIDLTQHYKTKHRIYPTNKQLQPRNKARTVVETKKVYTCDMCLFETRVKMNLRRHYLVKHQVEATDIQLRPALVENDISTPVMKSRTPQNTKQMKPDYPSGLHCKKCNKTFYWRNKLKEHYRQHNIEENEQLRLFEAKANNNNTEKQLTELQTAMDLEVTNAIDNIPGANAITIDAQNPMSNIEFDLNGDVLFEDFDEEENEDNNDDPQNLLLTSEDDFEEMLENDVQNGCRTCVHCNKKFFSQYQFENHMFVHRGLAPYRCEMCTNLYNTKRALIRHYKAVHKKLPTRDMIQAKGDKATDNTPIEQLNLEENKPITHMCAKCPYETTEMGNIEIHLRTSHGILNNEKYILHKLPYECPRCIRSYATKERLIRHLECCHSVATIIQHQQQKQNVNIASPISISSAKVPTVNQQNQSAATVHLASSINTSRGILEVNDNTSTSSTTTSTSSATLSTNSQMTKEATNTETAEVIPSIKTQSHLVTTTTTEARSPTVSTSTEPSLYSCKACSFVCNLIEDLDVHSKAEHINDVARQNFNFECSICNCKYRTIFLLKHHMKRHSPRKYPCPVCPKAYITKCELENHKILHTGVLPHVCDLCDKKFGYAHHLKRHKDVAHYGKRYMCQAPKCERTFTTRAQLKSHSLGHTGNFPYKCKFCGRLFKKRECLRQHAVKYHKVILTEEEIAEIYRNTVGYTNPHDFTIAVSEGKMLRRSDVEAALSSAEDTTHTHVQKHSVNSIVAEVTSYDCPAEKAENF